MLPYGSMIRGIGRALGLSRPGVAHAVADYRSSIHRSASRWPRLSVVTNLDDTQMSERSEPTPVALYARVSSDRQDVDLSVAAQLRALRDYADKNGYVVVREYVDEAVSGRVDDRPEFNKMIDEARLPEATFSEVLVWKFSRFTRKREHAVAYKSMLKRRGVRVVSITEHTDDTPTGNLAEGIIETVDEFYSEDLATDVRRGMREAASRGFWVSSRTAIRLQQGYGPGRGEGAPQTAIRRRYGIRRQAHLRHGRERNGDAGHRSRHQRRGDPKRHRKALVQ